MKRTAYETARLKLARVRVESARAVSSGLELVTQTVVDAMGVDRASVWFLEEDDSAIACRDLFLRSSRQHASGTVLYARDFPTYMGALRQSRAIVADAAAEHPLTRELGEVYLTPNRVASLLDAPIIRNGRVIGIVCHEREDTPRAWTQREVDFAGSVADLVALILEQADRVELEAALKVQTEQRLMQQKLEALALLARSVSHDLNNVLSILLMAAGEVEDQGLTETAQSISAAVEAGRNLSNQLHDVGARHTRRPERLDVGKVLSQLSGSLRMLASRRVRLQLELRDPEPYACIAQGDLERVVYNLVANARDAISDKGEICVIVRRAEPEAEDEPPDALVLEVADDGSGMDDRTRAHLFEPYFTTKPQGQGLGLATVYGIVTRVGGSIDVASAPGEGTRFRIVLPRAERAQRRP